MKPYKIEFDEIISDKDIKEGNLILLTGRPGTGKTLTCCRLVKKYEGRCLYFNLAGEVLLHWFKNGIPSNIISRYYTSVEIIKKIEDFIGTKDFKFVFIDYWQLLDDQAEWFIKMLMDISYNYKVVVIITTQLPRELVSRKSNMPKSNGLVKMNNLGIWTRKHVVIDRKYLYETNNVEDDLEYFIYRDGFE